MLLGGGGEISLCPSMDEFDDALVTGGGASGGGGEAANILEALVITVSDATAATDWLLAATAMIVTISISNASSVQQQHRFCSIHPGTPIPQSSSDDGPWWYTGGSRPHFVGAGLRLSR